MATDYLTLVGGGSHWLMANEAGWNTRRLTHKHTGHDLCGITSRNKTDGLFFKYAPRDDAYKTQTYTITEAIVPIFKVEGGHVSTESAIVL